jgi:hypothetical protein
MKYIYVSLIILIPSYCAHAQEDKPLNKNGTLFALQQRLRQNPVRSTVGITSIGIGSCWLSDTLKTAIDTREQPNTLKGTCLNATVAVGLISFGSYLLMNQGKAK